MQNKEIKLIKKSINVLAELDECFEKLSSNNMEKVNIYTKTKELVFWLTYYLENYEEK